MSYSPSAVVISGAVAKGPFAAGVLEALIKHGVPIRSLVGSSAGALNAALLAPAIRNGRALEGARELSRLWLDEVHAWNLARSLDLRALISRRGLLSMDIARETLATSMRRFVTGSVTNPVSATIVLSSLDARPSRFGTVTHEVASRFVDHDFDSRESIDRIALHAVASAAFPGLFAPIDVPGIGLCIDGGAVNNSPIGYAIKADPEIKTVFIVDADPSPALFQGGGGIALASRIVNILVSERRNRDVAEAHEVNLTLSRLDSLHLSPELHAAVKHAVGLGSARPLRIIPIQPDHPLPGSPFDGFFCRDLRVAYLDAGRRAAKAAVFTTSQ